jgi:hypothetical protein
MRTSAITKRSNNVEASMIFAITFMVVSFGLLIGLEIYTRRHARCPSCAEAQDQSQTNDATDTLPGGFVA